MNKNRALPAVISGGFAVYALVACAPESPPTISTATCEQHESRYCRGSHCDIDITVSSCSPAGITVPENELHLCKKNGTKTINWNLPPAGPYKFRDDGIDFVSLPNHDDFDPATKAKGSLKYSWVDKLNNGGGRSFKYAIRIQDGSGHPCDKDPKIIND